MPREKQGALVRQEDLFYSSWEQAHQELEGFSRNIQIRGHRTTWGEAAAPPPEDNTTGFVFSRLTGQTHLNKPLVQKVHIGYRVAVNAVLTCNLSKSVTIQNHTYKLTHTN